MVKEIKEENFKETIKEGRVLVDCYADWCGPCRMLSPIVDQLSEELKDINFYKLNVDDAEETSAEYGIMSIPTLLLFENGELKEQLVGFRSKDELLNILKK
jgi:thioredoxin 1